MKITRAQTAKYRKRKKTAAFLVVIILIILNLYYHLSHNNGDVPLYNYNTQSMYHEGFAEEGLYPDLFLRLAVKDKTVSVPHEERLYSYYSTYGRDNEDGNPFDRNYLIDNDYIRFLRVYAKEVEVDTTLPDKALVRDIFAESIEKFEDLGISNDMLRYTFLLNKEEVQQASAFWYSWYYHSFAERESREGRYEFPHVFVNIDSLENDEHLLALWDSKQNLYLMGDSFYDAIQHTD